MSTDAQHLTRARFTEMERQLAAVTAQRDEAITRLRGLSYANPNAVDVERLKAKSFLCNHPAKVQS